jgi:hypothetical protein
LNELSLKERLIELISNMSEDHQKDLLHSLERQQRGYRKYPRRPCSIETEYTIQNRVYKDFTENISTGGVYIKTNQTQSIGQKVTVTFMLAGYSKSITVTGKIVRVSAYGFALKFYRELQEDFVDLKNKSEK